MNNFFRAIIAGYGAKKLGGGCVGTILVFILIWVALGQCSFSPREAPAPQTSSRDRMALTSVPLVKEDRFSVGLHKDVTPMTNDDFRIITLIDGSIHPVENAWVTFPMSFR